MADRITISMMKYSWSKYGGPGHGLVKEELPEWYCQACGKLQTRGLPSYMIPVTSVSDRDFVRVCSQCEHILWSRGVEKVFTELNRLLRLKTHSVF